MSALILPEHLGPDSRERGEWRKTNVGLACSMALHDLAVARDIAPGELLGGMVEALISFIQASTSPAAWREAGDAVTDEIKRRMRAH